MDRPSDHGHAAQRLDERRAEGAEWRRQVPLSAQAEWKVPQNRADPVEILIEQGKSRIAELLPIRYARMKMTHSLFCAAPRRSWRPTLRPGRPPDCACRPAVTAIWRISVPMWHPRGPRSSMSMISTKRCRLLRMGCEASRCEPRRRRPGRRVPGAERPGGSLVPLQRTIAGTWGAGAYVAPRSLGLAHRSGRRHC